MQTLIKHWPWWMLAITFNSLVADILAKKDYTVLPMLLWTVSSLSWLLMLKNHVPLGLSMAVCCVMSFILTGLAAHFMFHEPITAQQALGYILGLCAIALLT